MRFVLAVHGTRGDVEPCAAVGLELQRRGHDVQMAVAPNMVDFVGSAGLAAVRYGPDSQEQLSAASDFIRNVMRIQHPRNIALVRRLAVELGLDPDLATADMADHVVPDIGVLKAYPEATFCGRHLTFVNGMSANERTGFVSNWERAGCERRVDESGRWVVTVVNNRFDRVARSKE